MPRQYLVKIEIEGFRGILNEGAPLVVELKTDAVNSIYASNSIGKSSIFDALCYAIKGHLPRFVTYQAREKPQEYLCNQFHSQGLSRVTLTFEADDASAAQTVISVSCDKTGVRSVTSPSGHPDPEGFLRSLDEEFALLDYRIFQSFLDDDANSRGRSFAKVLGLSSYSSFRQALQTCSNSQALNTDFGLKVLETKAAASKTALQALLGRAKTHFEKLTGKPFASAALIETYKVDVVEALAKHSVLKATLKGVEFDSIDFDAMKDDVRKAEGGEDRLKLQKVLERISSLENLGEASAPDVVASRDQLGQLIVERRSAIEETKGELFKKLYDAAHELMLGGALPPGGECPLCTSIPPEPLVGIIQSQITNFALVDQKTIEIRELWPEEPFIVRIAALEDSPELGIEADKRPLRALAAVTAEGSISPEQFEWLKARASELEALRLTKIAEAEETKTALEASLPKSLVELTEAVEEARQFADAVKEYKGNYPSYAETVAAQKRYAAWKDFVSDASTIFADAEERLTTKRLSGLKAGYSSFFETLSGSTDIKPVLTRAGAGEQLHVILSDFHGVRDKIAKAVLAESYRNALAIAIFLAAALKHSQTCRFIVLDDVTSSFDAGHQVLLMELLRTKIQQPTAPNGLQIVILSHDSMLEKYFDRLGSETNVAWHHQKLHGLSPTGMVMVTQIDGQRLATEAAKQIQAGNLEAAQHLIRQYAEFKLLQIITKLKIPVPIDFAVRDDKKMMGNALEAVSAALKLNKLAGPIVLTSQQEADFQNIHMPAVVGNFVSHYTSGSSIVLAGPVLSSIIQTIDSLTDCFRYDDTTTNPPTRRWYQSLTKK